MNHKKYLDKIFNHFPWKRALHCSYEEASSFVIKIGIQSQKEWNEYNASGKKPAHIPAQPQVYYKRRGKWVSWAMFLGTRNHKRGFCSYEEAKAYVTTMNLTGQKDWNKIRKLPEDAPLIPAGVERYYTNTGEWVSWGDFLGTGRQRQYRPYNEARDFARRLGLKSKRMWLDYSASGHKPGDIPTVADRVYQRLGGWVSWSDFLGCWVRSNVSYVSYEAAARCAHELGIRNREQWVAYCKTDALPQNIPRSPGVAYRKTGDWTCWADFLGANEVE